VMNRGEPLKFPRHYGNGVIYGSGVIENVQYKISYPAGIHAQSAAEAAIGLHPAVTHRLCNIRHIDIRTHRYARGILDRTGPLATIAARDHSLQYIVAICLIHGQLNANDYEDARAADPRIDALREKTVLTEHAPYTAAFYDPAKRANPNAIRVTFNDGTATDWREVIYPVGHVQRRHEGIPLLLQKFEAGVARVFAEKQRREIIQVCSDAPKLAAMPVCAFMDLLSA
jgi:2-methylcitrate dehydratase